MTAKQVASVAVSYSFDDLISFAAEQGSIAAAGDDSIFAVACQVMYSGASRAILKAQAKDVYKAYATAKNASGFGRKINLANDKVVNVQASKLGTFVDLGMTGNFDLPDRVMMFLDAMAGTKPSTFEAMCKVNRAQIKKGNKPLTDEEIAAALAPADKAETGVDEFLKKEIERFAKFDDENKPQGFDKFVEMLRLAAGHWLAGDEVVVTVAEPVTDNVDTEVNQEINVADMAAKLAILGKVTTDTPVTH